MNKNTIQIKINKENLKENKNMKRYYKTMNIISFLLVSFTGITFTGITFTNAFFWNIPLGNRFNIKSREIKQKIPYKLPYHDQQIINKINGFYGMIGPDINISTVTNLYDLFVGDGNIQGIFFNNGELTFIKHFIRTDKLVYEEKNGRIPDNHIVKAFFALLSKVRLLPNIMGLANTALMDINDKVYALYERDSPYLINIDFQKKDIDTVRKVDVESIPHFSAHSKFIDNVETIDYDIVTNSVNYFELNENLTISKRVNIKMRYLPVIHDFWVTPKKIVLVDSPLKIDMENLFIKPVPVILDKTKETKIHIINKEDSKIDTFTSDESFYIFHYAEYNETENFIDIYASLYDELDFSQLNISGKYRMIHIDKATKQVTIEKSIQLEQLDLDFPKTYQNKVVFRSIQDRIINGFVVCDKLKVEKQISFENRFICGEQVIKMIDNIPYLISFAFDTQNNNKSFILVINLVNYKIIEIPFEIPLNIGFHSIFLSK
jgi:hypothetical protein